MAWWKRAKKYSQENTAKPISEALSFFLRYYFGVPGKPNHAPTLEEAIRPNNLLKKFLRIQSNRKVIQKYFRWSLVSNLAFFSTTYFAGPFLSNTLTSNNLLSSLAIFSSPFAIGATSYWIARWQNTKLGTFIVTELARLFIEDFKLVSPFELAERSAQIPENLRQYINDLQNMLARKILLLTWYVPNIVGSVGFLTLLHPLAGVGGAATSIGYFSLSFYFANKMVDANRKSTEKASSFFKSIAVWLKLRLASYNKVEYHGISKAGKELEQSLDVSNKTVFWEDAAKAGLNFLMIAATVSLSGALLVKGEIDQTLHSIAVLNIVASPFILHRATDTVVIIGNQWGSMQQLAHDIAEDTRLEKELKQTELVSAPSSISLPDVKPALKRQLVVVTGVSGDGKSTLLRALAGEDLNPYHESIRYDEQSLARASVERFVVASFSIDLLGETIGACLSGTEVQQQEVLNYLRLSNVTPETKIVKLSDGQKQRVALAQPLLAVLDGQKEVAIFDEPEKHLDRRNAIRVANLLQGRCETDASGTIQTIAKKLGNEMAVVVATHHPHYFPSAHRHIIVGSDHKFSEAEQAPGVGLVPQKKATKQTFSNLIGSNTSEQFQLPSKNSDMQPARTAPTNKKFG